MRTLWVLPKVLRPNFEVHKVNAGRNVQYAMAKGSREMMANIITNSLLD